MALPISSFGSTVSSLAGASTNGDGAVVLLTLAGTSAYSQITIINTGVVAGFFSIDNWTTALYLPAGAAGAPASATLGSQTLGVSAGTTLQFRRATGGSDVTGVSAFAL